MGRTYSLRLWNKLANISFHIVIDEFQERNTRSTDDSREDAVAIKPFLSKIRDKCGDVITKVFMSDDADNFYNAWKMYLQ